MAATNGSTAPAPSGPANAASTATGAGLMEYFKGVRSELKKAEWPNRAEMLRLTQITLILIAIVAAYCGGLDALLSLVTNKLFMRPAVLPTVLTLLEMAG